MVRAFFFYCPWHRLCCPHCIFHCLLPHHDGLRACLHTRAPWLWTTTMADTGLSTVPVWFFLVFAVAPSVGRDARGRRLRSGSVDQVAASPLRQQLLFSCPSYASSRPKSPGPRIAFMYRNNVVRGGGQLVICVLVSKERHLAK